MTRGALRVAPLAAVPGFFALKVGSALILLAASSAWLEVAGFAAFTQLLILAALVNLVAVGGAQNGIIRLTAADVGDGGLDRMRGAAFVVWLAIFAVTACLAILLRERLSVLLVGDEGIAAGAMLVVLLTLAAGPGQIFTSLLTGRGRAAASMAAQGAGLLTGMVAALILLHRGESEGAAIAFAAGPLVTMTSAWLMLRAERLAAPSFEGLLQSIRALLSYSGATVLIAVFSAATLFALRYVYQEAFGLETLAQWIAANRISDTTTQFLGLAILQLFLPRYTQTHDSAQARRLVLTTWAAGLAMMGLFLAVFATASEFLVKLFLSADYLPAISAILLYMVGDMLRVWAAVAMNVLLARGRPWAFASIEVGTMAMMAALALALISVGEPLAPMYAYVAAYGLTALIVSLVFARSLFATRRAGSAQPVD